MDERVASKLARHAKEGVTYPNPGAASAAGLTPDQARYQAKLAAREAAAKVAAAAPAPAPAKKTGKDEHKA